MNLAKTVTTLTFALATFGLAGCGGGVEGTYKLDKAEMKKAMEAEVAKLPAEQQGLAKLAMALVDRMDMSLELQSGGKLKMKATMPGLEEGKPGKSEDKEGTWKLDGESVVLEADGKPMKCAKGAGKLTCSPSKPGDPSLVFVKS